jgi:hypothetical protein
LRMNQSCSSLKWGLEGHQKPLWNRTFVWKITWQIAQSSTNLRRNNW